MRLVAARQAFDGSDETPVGHALSRRSEWFHDEPGGPLSAIRMGWSARYRPAGCPPATWPS